MSLWLVGKSGNMAGVECVAQVLGMLCHASYIPGASLSFRGICDEVTLTQKQFTAPSSNRYHDGQLRLIHAYLGQLCLRSVHYVLPHIRLCAGHAPYTHLLLTCRSAQSGNDDEWVYLQV